MRVNWPVLAFVVCAVLMLAWAISHTVVQPIIQIREVLSIT